MHPLAKIVTVLIVSIFVGISGWGSVFITALLLIPLYIYFPHFFGSAWRMIRRLKWFYLSILLVYLLFNPQSAPTPDASWFDLSRLDAGGFRVSVLIMIVLSVNLLIRTSDQKDLLSGLYLLIKPFKWLGFSPKKFILRAYLSLNYIQTLDRRLKTEKGFFKRDRSIKKMVPRLADFISDWIDQARLQTTGQSIQINLLKYPKLKEWIIPILLILVYIYLPSQLERFL